MSKSCKPYKIWIPAVLFCMALSLSGCGKEKGASGGNTVSSGSVITDSMAGGTEQGSVTPSVPSLSVPETQESTPVKSAGEQYIQLGMQQIADRDYPSAVSSFNAAEAAGEDKRLASRGKGIAYMGMTEYASAIDSFQKCLSYSNGILTAFDYDVDYYLAAAYSKNQEDAKAQQIYDAILELKPEETDAYFLRGNVKLRMGDFDAAKKDFDETVRLKPGDYDRLIKIYELLQNSGYKEAGQAYLTAALNERGDKMSAYDKGRVYFYLEDYQQAYVSLEGAKAKAGSNAEVYLYLGRAYEATGDYNYAINNVYNTYLSKNEGNAQIYNQLGLCYMKQEDYQNALAAFQNGLQAGDASMMQSLQFNEVVAYEYLGDYASAAALLNSYMASYPDDEAAQREYGFLSTR